MSVPPPAVGTRLPYSQLPARIREAIGDRSGVPVVAAEDQHGGLSPGCAARLRLADGRRVFVKAAGASINPDTPELYRKERDVLARLPAAAPAARLVWSHDDGDWVVLCLDDVDGVCPEVPWSHGDLGLVVATMDAMMRDVSSAAVDTLPAAETLLESAFLDWARIRDSPPADLPDWPRRHLDRLVDLVATGPRAVAGDTLVHLDIRADNILITPDGRVRLVDWTWACRGSAWIDPVMFAVFAAREGTHQPEDVLYRSEAARSASPHAVSAVLAALAGDYTAASRRPEPPSLPTVRAFQRSCADTALAWLARRTDWA